MTTLVLTAIGDDRAGLVEALADVIAEHGGNWESSHMAEMAGKFAGIVMVTVPAGKVDGLTAALGPLEAQGLLDISLEKADPDAGDDTRTRAELTLVGLDQPGIVRDLSRAVAARGMSIDELQTDTKPAPMAGGLLFEASVTLALPEGATMTDLLEIVDGLTEELNVDIDIARRDWPGAPACSASKASRATWMSARISSMGFTSFAQSIIPCQNGPG